MAARWLRASAWDPDRWRRGFDELTERIASRFARVEPRQRVGLFLLGLLAGLPRVNCWTIAVFGVHRRQAQ